MWINGASGGAHIAEVTGLAGSAPLVGEAFLIFGAFACSTCDASYSIASLTLGCERCFKARSS